MVSLSPVISRLSAFIALLLICPALVVTGCGKDELGGTFQAPERDPEDNDSDNDKAWKNTPFLALAHLL